MKLFYGSLMITLVGCWPATLRRRDDAVAAEYFCRQGAKSHLLRGPGCCRHAWACSMQSATVLLASKVVVAAGQPPQQ